MKIDAVRSLLLAAELGSFSAAADQLGVPTSTISRRVAELEEELGSRILVRTGRGVRPADESREALVRLRDVLIAVDACYQPPSAMTRLRVTSPMEMGISLLPKLIPAFRQRHPDVIVEIRGDQRAVGLLEEDFDLAIRAGALVDSGYLARKLRSGRFVVVAAPALAGQIQTQRQLASAPFVEGPRPRLSGRWNGKPFDVRPPFVARVDTFTSALPLVLAGHALAAMPLHVAADLLVSGRLVEIAAAQLEEVDLNALYPRRHSRQQALFDFIDAVDGALGENPS